MAATILGLDPGGGRSPTGVAALHARPEGEWLRVLILEIAETRDPLDLVPACLEGERCIAAIDAPLSLLPRGLRPSERILARCTRTPFLPHGLPGIRRLHAEASRLARELEGMGYTVAETYPAAARRVLGLGDEDKGHACDALLAAIAGLALHVGAPLGAGDGMGEIVLPAPLPAFRAVYRVGCRWYRERRWRATR